MPGWLTPADVAAVGNITDVSGNDALASATAAAVAFVERKRPDIVVTAEGEETTYAITDDVKHGTAMLGARLYERRGSVLGISASAGYEESAQILRYDPDIEQLLRIGRATPFGFGASA